MENCIFCKIVSGEVSCDKVWEDENFLCFLDLNPVNFGHLLLIPKKHYPHIVETPDEIVGEIFKRTKEIMPKLKSAMESDYVVLSVVGTEVPHLHIHLIPRYFNDGLADFWPTKKYADGEMRLVAEKISKVVG